MLTGTDKLLVKDLKNLYAVSGGVINKWIKQGKFSTAQKVPGRGGNGWVWTVDIKDPNISQDIRALWRKLVETSRGLETPETGTLDLIKAVERIDQGIKQVVSVLIDIRELLKGKK
jgi:hypothetical protein